MNCPSPAEGRTTRHVRAVILLGGWVLLVPPIRGDGTRDGRFDFEPSMPLSRWRNIGAFDRADDCRAALNSLFRTRREKLEKQGIFPEVIENAFVKGDDLFSSQCVPAEALYPPHPPTKK